MKTTNKKTKGIKHVKAKQPAAIPAISDQHAPAKEAWKRKLFHILSGTVVIVLFMYGQIDALVLAFIACVGILFAIGQHLSPRKSISWFLKQFDRDERIPGRGAITFVMGLCIASLFPYIIALAVMAVLVWGDGMAGLIGSTFGKRQLWTTKTVEGSIAFLLFGFCAAWLITKVPVTVAYACAISGMIVELFPVPRKHPWNVLDDNILIPLVVGLTLLFIAH